MKTIIDIKHIWMFYMASAESNKRFMFRSNTPVYKYGIKLFSLFIYIIRR